MDVEILDIRRCGGGGLAPNSSTTAGMTTFRVQPSNSARLHHTSVAREAAGGRPAEMDQPGAAVSPPPAG